jgi:uncharacterized protein DUF2877
LSVGSVRSERILGEENALSSVVVDWELLRGCEKSPVWLSAIEQLVLASERSPALARESARRSEAGLVDGLAKGDLGAIALGARGLAGLGEGRTPAGDDFLVGALHAVWMCVPAEIATVMAATVAEAAAPLTTRQSARWLLAAARGEAIPAWRDLLAALAADRDAVAGPLAGVAATGHSSGLASLAGFVAAWRALERP